MTKTLEQIEKMRVAGRLTARVLEALSEVIRPGMTTMDVDIFCEQYIRNELSAIPGSKGQYGYPYSVNTSVNHVICHGMPSPTQILKKGDIVNVDVTVIKDGYYGDSSKMFCIGDVTPAASRLVEVTQQCLYRGIQMVKPGASLGDIGHAIQSHAEANDYSVVREYCGHGIGSSMHEDPQVLHYGQPGVGVILEAGMTFTIEPMINQGKKNTHIKHIRKDLRPIYNQLNEDGLSLDGIVDLINNPKMEWDIAVTKDRRLSAQWEHTILVTPDGFEILTLREEERPFFQ